MKQRAQFRCVNAQDAEEILRRKDVLVLDVRDAENFRRGRLECAQHVSMANLSPVINGTAKDRPILIYCYHGHASREYAQVFCDFGFSEVHSLDGGYEGWRKRALTASRPVADRTLQQWLAVQGFSASDVNSVIANATTPLMTASHQGACDVVRMLAAAGARLNARNADGNNALWLACVGGHLDVIATLVELGVDVNNRNDNGATPLMYAASAGKADVVERLLSRGADTAPETLDGFTALDMAATVECLTLLRRASNALSAAEA
ncbi:MAG: ankyrin repeat domain-containing protein [Hyphomicrobium sp.]|jgi:thiosulfate/3-mercaptopyruvate sulfurtransferase